MSYGLLGLRRDMESDAMQGLGDLAGQQGQQKRANEAMKTAERGQKMSAVGMGAAMGGMAAGARQDLVSRPHGRHSQRRQRSAHILTGSPAEHSGRWHGAIQHSR